MILEHTADREGRLSSFLRGEMRLSGGLMNKLKWGDAIQVNGIVRHTNFPVAPGDRVTVRLDEPSVEYPAQDGELTILYEDAWLLAVDKPAGMLIHPSRAKNEGTLANFVAGYYRRTGQDSAFHPLTRLDRDTFGVVLLGKNAYVHTLLQEVPVQKTYHALTYGIPESPAGVIDLPIGRKPLPSLLREIRPDGKPSVTQYRVMEIREGCARLSLRPVTGRTHQLRVHCAGSGFPILGDPQYGSDASRTYSEGLGLTSQLLCAHSLVLNHPITEAPLEIASRLDVNF